MSQPLRFKPVNPAHEMIYSPDGGWVSWEDYARLKAEVERLTKAGEGNSMWGVVAPYVVPPCIDKYTAKEGKQFK
jgi:hypothetical protein